MDELVFENDRIDSPRVAKVKMSQNSSATNAFKEFSRGVKDDASPNRKHILNQKAKAGVKPHGKVVAVSELSPQALLKNKDLQTGGLGGPVRGTTGPSALNDVKDLGVVGGKKRGD